MGKQEKLNCQNPDLWICVCIKKLRNKEKEKSAAFLQLACLSLPLGRTPYLHEGSELRAIGGMLDKRVNVGPRC